VSASFSPAPWRHEGFLSSAGGHYVLSAHGAMVANCGGPPNNAGVEANANLIAAAPDLYAACRAALALGEADDLRDVNAMLRAALAKAEGRQP
jgi:hypothetical protein